MLTSVPEEIQIEFTRRVRSDFAAMQEYVRPKHEQFVQWLENYHNKKGDKPKGMANCPVPLTKQTINVVVADMVDKMFGTNLQIDTAPREESDDLANTANRDLIRYQAYINGWKRKLRRLVFNILTFGVGPAKIAYTEEYKSFTEMTPIADPFGNVYDYVRKAVEKLVYQGPDLITIDPLDFFIDPAMIDINDDLPVIHRINCSVSHLIGRQKQGMYENVDVLLSRIQAKEFIPQMSDIDNTFKSRRRALSGVTYKVDESNFITCLEWQGKFDINDDGIEEDVIGVVCDSGDSKKDALLFRFDESPYHHKKKTYVCGKIFEIEGEFWGVGLADSISSEQEAATSLLNSTLDAYYKLARPRVYAREGAVTNPQDIASPWKVLTIIDEQRPIGDLIQEQAPIPIGTDGLMLFNQIMSNGQAASGVQDVKTGAVPGQKTTATVGNMAFAQASLLFKDMLEQIEETAIIPACDMANAINQQFIDTAYAVQIIGQKGRYWTQVRPEEIAGQRNFVSLASMKNGEKTILAEQLMKSIQVAGANPQLMPAQIIAYVKLWEALELPDLEILKTALGYYQFIGQVTQMRDMQIMPYQQMLLQNNALGINAGKQPSGNVNPYTTSQEQAPVNQEEVIAQHRAGITRNMPPQYGGM